VFSAAPDAELSVRTSAAFLDRWAAGDLGWDDGRARGEVTVDGAETSWLRWLAATGYLLRIEPAPVEDAEPMDPAEPAEPAEPMDPAEPAEPDSPQNQPGAAEPEPLEMSDA
jgi:hypothetical protein